MGINNSIASPVSVSDMNREALNHNFYDASAMAMFRRYNCRGVDEWNITDLSNALKNGKECRRWELSVSANERGYIEPICNILNNAGIHTTAELMAALKSDALFLDGVKIKEDYPEKAVKIFSPLLVSPIKKPKRWTVLLAVKAVLSGQAVIENCDWDVAFDVVKDANEGHYSFGVLEKDGVVSLYAYYLDRSLRFRFMLNGGAFPEGCSNILEAKKWQEEVNRKEEQERLEQEAEEHKRRLEAEKALQSVVDSAMDEYPLQKGEPFVKVFWSEHPAFYNLIPDNEHPLKMSILAADKAFGVLDMERHEEEYGYDKTRFNLCYKNPMTGNDAEWADRYDLGDGFGGLFEFMEHYRPRADAVGLFMVLDDYKALVSNDEEEAVETTVTIWDGLESFLRGYMKNKDNN